MPPIGETLREARMRQKLDIADVERQTKIRAKYLRALENEEFGMLPGPTFVKTFLRTYAEVLGLDPHAAGRGVPQPARAARRARDAAAARPARGAARPRPAPPAGPRPVDASPCCSWSSVIVGLVALGLSTDDEDGGGDETRPTAHGDDHAHRADRPATPGARAGPARRVAVRIAPTTPTYVCVDTGAGTEVTFEGTLEAARTFGDARAAR